MNDDLFRSQDQKDDDFLLRCLIRVAAKNPAYGHILWLDSVLHGYEAELERVRKRADQTKEPLVPQSYEEDSK